ncbi:RNA polymerase II degradation factor 1-like isoform X1 [Anopheles albimanus]|uniref:RNA polymerase II degradation factor 1-like isoform X1 n=1 Tax=Anopheles albimanus TaxID=7167 RepID=UPI001641A32E|nr:RNA polymerase II degradation factor 1-like isoform X1 [Anopheles albimanus]XP_035781293.1 RNA polymerase II degradation factor 1-like isoform X1 [Anopheles albimanus]
MYTSTTYTDPGRVGDIPVAKSLYRREFDEMENRIRKCERERAELERKFADLMRERAECERATARAMKQRYKRIAEAERQRAERNESILRMLNKVDQQAASLAAKTDRLKMLKTQYEMYLMRTWPSTAQSYHTATPMAAIMAPPPPPPHSATPSILASSSRAPAPKSEFVQYLSDLTHQQTASVHPIPPPTALSNYLVATQKSSYQLNTAGYGLGSKDDYLPTRMTTNRTLTLPDDGAEAPDRTKAKRFEMSNEDFIRYIDTEVLKESAPIPKVNVQAPPSPEAALKQEQKTATAYLEDVTVSEDEQQQREPVADLSEPLDQFSIIVDQAANSDDKPVTAVDRLKEPLPKTASEVEQDTEDHQTPIENFDSSATLGVTSDVVTEYPAMESVIAESPKTDYEAIGATRVDEYDSSAQPHLDENSKSLEDVPGEPEYRPATAVTFCEETLNYPPEQEEHQVYQQQPGYAEDYVSSEGYYNEALPDSTYAVGAESNAYGETTQPHATDQYHNQEQMYDTLPASAESRPIQPPTTAGNPHWGMARQAMRARTFPTVKSKPPSPEMQTEMAETRYESVSATVSEAPNAEQTQSVYSEQMISEEEGSGGVYAPYSEQPVQDTVQATAQDHEAPIAQQYLQEDGQSVAYPEAQYDASQSGDTIQATTGPPYQYQSPEASAYQEGQYSADPASTDQTAYQYQEGIDQSMANQYTANDAVYGDPNQQYQYDAQNAQYYNDQQQQQQQGYEGQYCTEDQQQQQQQQQQYYMEDPNQQQADPGQYEAQQSAEGYPAGQEYYAAPDEQQYQVEPAQQHSAESDTNPPIPADDVAATAQEPSVSQSNTDVVPSQNVEPEATAAAGPVVDKKTEASKPSAGQQPPGAKGTTQVPATDSPIVSSANDESDFDFSTQ